MGSLRYAGKSADGPNSVGHKSYVDEAKTRGVTLAQVDSTVSSRISGYATQAYADQQDALRATKDYVDQQDALRLPYASRGASNGAVPLDAWSLVPESYLSSIAARTHAFPYGVTNIQASGTVTSTATNRLLGQINCDGFSDVNWIPLVFGYWEAKVNSGTNCRPMIEVRVGGSTGQVIARGYGATYRTNYHQCIITPSTTIAEIGKGASTLYIYGKITATGSVEFTNYYATAMAWVVPGTGS